MNKKGKNIELKIYELLGIKTFKKLVFVYKKILCFPFIIFMSKEEHEAFCNSPSNYEMKKGHGIQDLKDFKKYLLLNATVHILALLVCMPSFFKIIAVGGPILIPFLGVVLTAYCVMLQRYNYIRINQAIKKVEPHEEKKKNKIKEELIKEDSLLRAHTYKVVDKCDKKDITLEELLETATYDQLVQYRAHLSYFKEVNQMIEENENYYFQKEVRASAQLDKNKTLIFELNSKSKNENVS